jgi:hypothetical protein
LAVLGKLSTDVSALVEDRLKNETIELLRFELLVNGPDPFSAFSGLGVPGAGE